ncbi:hypothetical protein VNO78_10592 [Psophocarpus tetragonolobus]|uniref:Uncharacterized protein n=1 Tax=Psophocarpus tetragonolobus TaxID=3891 RepID=A0AAN9SJZ8_PSOTE
MGGKWELASPSHKHHTTLTQPIASLPSCLSLCSRRLVRCDPDQAPFSPLHELGYELSLRLRLRTHLRFCHSFVRASVLVHF